MRVLAFAFPLRRMILPRLFRPERRRRVWDGRVRPVLHAEGTRLPQSRDSARLDIIIPAPGRNRFDDGVVCRCVQDIIVAEIQRYVSDAFDPRLVVT